jgi:hypothetical protein
MSARIWDHTGRAIRGILARGTFGTFDMRKLTPRLVLALALLTFAAPAYAATKPPIRGLISMGAYRFVSAGGQPVNTLAPVRAKSGVFGGIVIVASWQQLQPQNGNQLQTNVIDQMLAQIRIYNVSHPRRPLAVKLRVWGGFMAPPWAKQLGGAPIAATHNGKARTIGRFWGAPYRLAWANLQKLLAAHYDNEPLIRETAVTSCMSFTAEPFFLPSDPAEGIVALLKARGFTDAVYRDCLSKAVGDYAPWKQTRVVLAVNPYRIAPGQGDAVFTQKVMFACRAALRDRCVLDNHDLDKNIEAPLKPIYAYMKTLGPLIEFQTFHETPADFPGTIKFGIANGAQAIELWQDFQGFPLVPAATLSQWADWLEAPRARTLHQAASAAHQRDIASAFAVTAAMAWCRPSCCEMRLRC